MTKHLFISGPMLGHEDFNSAAFHEAAHLLGAAGYQVTNPANNSQASGERWKDRLRAEVKEMMDCDGVVILEGWQWSRVANAQINLAHALGMPVHSVTAWLAAIKQPKQTEATPC